MLLDKVDLHGKAKSLLDQMSTVGGLELPELVSNVLFCHLTSFDHSFEPTSDDILDSHNFDTGAALNADSTTHIQHARLFGIIEAGTQFRTPK